MDSNTGTHLRKVVIILGPTDHRAWEAELALRLRHAGYSVGIELSAAHPTSPFNSLDRILALEQRRFGQSLASFVPPLAAAPLEQPDLIIDLNNESPQAGQKRLQIRFNGQAGFEHGIAGTLSGNSLPVITTLWNGETVGIARPMLSDRLWISRMSNEMLAGALALIEQSVARYFAGALHPVAHATPLPPSQGFWRYYLPHVASNAAGRLHKKLTSRRPFYWQVAYRNTSNAAASAGLLDRPSFAVLPDDGQRFYADPFVLERGGRPFLFVEEYPYGKAKGVISVAEQEADGRFGVPRIVLEEPYHLSYPQVFEDDGEIFMLPESGGARKLVLYRAAAFSDQWVVDTVLLADIDINDATLLVRNGTYWLFGTERRGAGSASDTMVVFHAPALRGPWRPHQLNPIMIDRSAARPGGAFIERSDGRTFLPVQNGQDSYGGGLGLMELLQLDHEAVRFAPPEPVRMGQAWNRKGIHTLNRAGSIEVVDSAG
jgi:hypothetical protein